MYVVHNLNDLDAYTLHTVHEQDSVVARNKRKGYTGANMIYAYIALVLLTSSSQNLSSNSCASVKFKLSCTVAICEEGFLLVYGTCVALRSIMLERSCLLSYIEPL